MVTGFSFKAKVRALVPGARFKFNISNRRDWKIMPVIYFLHFPFLDLVGALILSLIESFASWMGRE